MTYKIQIDNFEGPLDLLLYFIRRDELDIYDIPIGKITKEFISMIEEWKRLNLLVAGEFIVMASTLMRIKAKMMIPRPDLDESVILDCMQGKIYVNDRQVKQKHIYWGLDRERSRTHVRVSPLEVCDLPSDF